MPFPYTYPIPLTGVRATLTGSYNTQDCEVTSVGFVWGTSSYEDPGDVQPEDTNYDNYVETSVQDNFEEIIQLLPNTTYYYRAFAENAGGITYSDEIQFTTPWLDTGQVSINETMTIDGVYSNAVEEQPADPVSIDDSINVSGEDADIPSYDDTAVSIQDIFIYEEGNKYHLAIEVYSLYHYNSYSVMLPTNKIEQLIDMDIITSLYDLNGINCNVWFDDEHYSSDYPVWIEMPITQGSNVAVVEVGEPDPSDTRNDAFAYHSPGYDAEYSLSWETNKYGEVNIDGPVLIYCLRGTTHESSTVYRYANYRIQLKVDGDWITVLQETQPFTNGPININTDNYETYSDYWGSDNRVIMGPNSRNYYRIDYDNIEAIRGQTYTDDPDGWHTYALYLADLRIFPIINEKENYDVSCMYPGNVVRAKFDGYKLQSNGYGTLLTKQDGNKK